MGVGEDSIIICGYKVVVGRGKEKLVFFSRCLLRGVGVGMYGNEVVGRGGFLKFCMVFFVR